MRWIGAIGAIILMFSVIGTTEVRAADPDFCRDYATAAVRQTHAAWDYWRCRRGAQPPRWTADWHAHFDWCLSAPWEAARRERQIRHDWLASCHY